MADLELKRGDDRTIQLTYKDSDGNAIDITGYTVFFTVKSAIDNDTTDANAIISKTITSHSDPTNGITNIALTASDTNVTPGIYTADIQIKTGGGSISSSDRFSVSITGDVTRRTT